MMRPSTSDAGSSGGISYGEEKDSLLGGKRFSAESATSAKKGRPSVVLSVPSAWKQVSQTDLMENEDMDEETDDDEDIGFESRQRGGVLVSFQAQRMTKLEAMAGGVRGKRLRCLAHATSAAPWRLRVDGDDVMVGGKPVERRDGESRASHEDDPPAGHRLPLVAAIDLAEFLQRAANDHVAFQP